MIIREANLSDATELVRLRWDYSPDQVAQGLSSRESFQIAFSEFIQTSLASMNWKVWVIDSGKKLHGNLYLQIISKVPRPGQFTNRWGYATNIYVEEAFRNQGWGGAMVEAAASWAQKESLEFVILWPSQESVSFYQQHGFVRSGDAWERHVKPNHAVQPTRLPARS